MLTLHEHLIPLMFCKGVRGFQAFVLFLFSLDYALLISHMGILHWALMNFRYAFDYFVFALKLVPITTYLT